MGRQIAMVLDLNKCLGCQTCTVACKRLWTSGEGQGATYFNHVETHPARGFPRDWQGSGGGFERRGRYRPGCLPGRPDYGGDWVFNQEELYFGGGVGRGDRLQSKGGEPIWGPNWEEDQGGGAYPNAWYFYLPRLCNHCTHPACLEACPRAAIGKRDSDGIVLLDETRCHGYRHCLEACPYKKLYWNHAKTITQKCIFCFPRVEEGMPPACARECPGRLRFVGFRDDPKGPIAQLVEVWKVALPLHPEFGTSPNVFYVPPLSPPKLDREGRPTKEERIPKEALRGLFGPPLDRALETLRAERERARRGERSDLMDLLIARRWKENFRLLPRTA